MFTIWMTGLSGSGKTTIAKEIAFRFHINTSPILHLDGDEVRKFVNSDLKYSMKEREAHLKRIAGIAYLANLNRIPVIVSTISPTEKIRKYAKNTVHGFIEVYVKCSIEECIRRDPKNIYKKEKNQLIGVDLKYEIPRKPDIILDTEKQSLQSCVRTILNYIPMMW